VAAIEVDKLERRFGDEVYAVQGIDLQVDEGEIYAFLGPNGAGKTTTVRMLTTLLRPSGGTARVAGHDVVHEASDVRRAIGVALQEAAVLHGIRGQEGRERAEDLLERVGLLGAADRRIGTYSGGMRRRLDLGTALVHEPRVLFLDEPTTGLDPVSRAAIWDEVRHLNDEGTTVFLTTQYMEEADQLADRIGIIAEGIMAAEGPPASLKAEVGVPRLEVAIARGDIARAEEVLGRHGELLPTRAGTVMITLPGGASEVAGIVRALDGAGLPVESLDVVQPTLDDVFVVKTGRSLEGAGDVAPA